MASGSQIAIASATARIVRHNYYDSIHNIRSISELKAMIKVIEDICAEYKINPDLIFWTNEKFASSKPEDYMIV